MRALHPERALDFSPHPAHAAAMSGIVPDNDLDRAIMKLRKSKAALPEFMRALGQGELWVLVPWHPEVEDLDFELKNGESLPFSMLTDQDGSVVPIFSSHERAREAVKKARVPPRTYSVAGLEAKVVLQILGSMNLRAVVNKSCRTGEVTIGANMMRDVANGSAFETEARGPKTTVPLRILNPADYPTELVQAAFEFVRQHSSFRAAWIFGHTKKEGEPEGGRGYKMLVLMEPRDDRLFHDFSLVVNQQKGKATSCSSVICRNMIGLRRRGFSIRRGLFMWRRIINCPTARGPLLVKPTKRRADSVAGRSATCAVLLGSLCALAACKRVADKPKAGFDARVLDYQSPTDPALQSQLEAIDATLRERLGMTTEQTAAGLLDLRTARVAMLHPDRITYAASVAKIGILLAYFDLHPEAATHLPPTTRHELGQVVKASSNEMAAKFSHELGLAQIQQVLDKYGFYSVEHGGGLWVGKHYGESEERLGDPVANHSHGATVRQLLRFYLLLEQGKLVSPDASRVMREIFESPSIPHDEIKFVKALADRPGVRLLRKWGTWENWRHDTAIITGPNRHYILVGLTEHPQGDEYLIDLARSLDDLLAN